MICSDVGVDELGVLPQSVFLLRLSNHHRGLFECFHGIIIFAMNISGDYDEYPFEVDVARQT